jgi:DNA repair protein RadD
VSVELRPYQTELVDGLRAVYAGGKRRALGQLPTGGGKGRILGHMARTVSARGKRILIVAHRVELVDQICANLDDEGVCYGRIQPGWPMLGFPVMVGMVQTVCRRIEKIVAPDMIFIDECHHSPAGQYQAVFAAWPRAYVLGVSATPARSDGLGLDDCFDEIVLGPSMRSLIDAGHLADYDYYEPSPDFDAAGLSVVAGDFSQASALKAMGKAKIVGDAVAHYRHHLDGRPAIAFCMGVDHTHDVADKFRAAGIAAAGVDGKMPLELRRARLAALASGEISVLTAADVISEGVDIPHVAGAILLRPTCGVGLYLQQVGRALRRKPDGSRAVILDHVGNGRRHGYPADPRRWSLTGKVTREVLATRTCETCHRVFQAGTARETAEAECEQREQCPMLVAKPVALGSRSPGDVVDGVLTAAVDPWAWAGGIDPVRAYGAELKALIARAETQEQFQQIARARGYKWQWAKRQVEERGMRWRTAA